MKSAVVVFPGSNCDHDAYHVLRHVLGGEASFVWHKETSLAGYDLVVLPGGFSYGDYLRCGAIARFSPVMKAVAEHARHGGLLLGICNGFQVLTEAGLLPGALIRNRGVSFLSRDVWLRVDNAATKLTSACRKGEVLCMPIGHGEGNYHAAPEVLDRLEGEGRVLFRYVGPQGELADPYNVNGSARAIAGIVNEQGNVFGMMPHPERNAETILGSGHGIKLFAALVGSGKAVAA
jgi:phosphoribosylformylglycinamidine synthase I